MSNKKYRTPPKDDAGKQTSTQEQRHKETYETNDEFTVDPQDYSPDAPANGRLGGRYISELEAKLMLARSARLLDMVEEFGLRLLSTVRADDLRNVVAEDVPLSEQAKQAGWKEPAKPEKTETKEADESEAGAKADKGGKPKPTHPLIRFIYALLRTSRLKERILAIVQPDIGKFMPMADIKRWLWVNYEIGEPPRKRPGKDPLRLPNLPDLPNL